MRETWMSDAACAQVGTEFWFPEKGGSTQAAKTVCAACPVIEQCRQFALTNGETFGIWGGLTVRELRRERQAA